MFNFQQYAFGRKRHNPLWVRSLTPHLFGASGPVPVSVSRSEWTPSLVQNDVLPTCTVAALINSARIWSIVENGFDLTSSDPAMLAFFATVAKCADTNAAIAATEGLTLESVLLAAEQGQFTAGQQTPLVPIYRALDLSSMGTSIRDAIYQCVSAYIGVTLYEADVQQGATWTGDIKKAGKPVGGHAFISFAYDSASVTAATWGGTMQADDEWLDSRCDEAYSLEWTLQVAPKLVA